MMRIVSLLVGVVLVGATIAGLVWLLVPAPEITRAKSAAISTPIATLSPPVTVAARSTVGPAQTAQPPRPVGASVSSPVPTPVPPRREAKIRLVDWTNHSQFGYCTVKGYVHNDGDAPARFVRATVKGLDAGGGLVDLVEAYTTPMVVQAGGEGTFEAILSNSERIKTLRVGVSWSEAD